ncbi:MAG: hypothetical protein HUU37_09370 [Bdellovibrionales bacterium]|nr:hypothetical protein [Bdellovibrionales bacterium]
MKALFLVFLPLLAAAGDPRSTCTRMKEGDPMVYSDDFKQRLTMEEMRAKFEEMYQGPKRLKHRAYWDRQRKAYVMEVQANEKMVPVVLPASFVASVTRHVEIALERRYADFVFFPDMGHSHFYFAEGRQAEFNKVSDRPEICAWLMNEPSLKVLYHTAERLMQRADEGRGELFPGVENQWRYYTRNVVGDVRGGETLAPVFAWEEEGYNTVSALPGHAKYSSGFNLHASKDGCFPYRHKGKTYWFDLSWYDLEYSESGGSSGY